MLSFRRFVIVLVAIFGLLAPIVAAPAAQALPSEQAAASWYTNGTVWDMVRVGNIIYIGGEFTQLRSTNGQTLSRTNLAAIHALTGEPQSWAPTANGPVLSMEKNSAGTRVFVGGDFSRISGVSRQRVASVRVSDGSVDTAFRADTGGRVRTMVRTGNQLYLGGEIAAVNGQSRGLVARVNATSGALDGAFRPSGSGGAVRGMDLSPDGNRLYLAGAFTQFNGSSSTRYIAAIRTADGTTSAWRVSMDMPLFDVESTSSNVYLAVGGTGIPNNRLQKHSAATGGEILRYIGDGDIQDLELEGNLLYIGGHSGTDFGGLERNMVAAIDIRDDHIVDWAPNVVTDYGVWKIIADPDGVWIGGEFTSVGGQARRGFAAFREVGGKTTKELMDRFGSWRYWARGSQPASGISWAQPAYNDGSWSVGRAELGFGDDDEGTVTSRNSRTTYARRTFTVNNPGDYESFTIRLHADAGAAVYLNGSEVVRDNLPTWNLSYSDYALSAEYTLAERLWTEHTFASNRLRTGTNTIAIEVHLPWDNHEDMSLSAEIVGTLGTPNNTPFTCSVTANANGSATISWTNQGANGYDVSHDGGGATWRTNTSWTDTTPGTNYTVTAWGLPGADNGKKANCTNPGGPGGGTFTCSVTANANGSVTVSWNNQNVGGYDVRHPGQSAVWVTGTSWTDNSPGTTYTVIAWGQGDSTTCNAPGGNGFNCTVTVQANGNKTISWNNQGASGYDISHDGGPAAWTTSTSWNDTSPGTNYTVTAWGLAGADNGKQANCN